MRTKTQVNKNFFLASAFGLALAASSNAQIVKPWWNANPTFHNQDYSQTTKAGFLSNGAFTRVTNFGQSSAFEAIYRDGAPYFKLDLFPKEEYIYATGKDAASRPIVCSLSSSAGKMYVRKLDSTTGAALWKKEILQSQLVDGSFYPNEIFAYGNDIYMGGISSLNHVQVLSVLCLDTNSGTIKWAWKHPSPIGANQIYMSMAMNASGKMAIAGLDGTKTRLAVVTNQGMTGDQFDFNAESVFSLKKVYIDTKGTIYTAGSASADGDDSKLYVRKLGPGGWTRTTNFSDDGDDDVAKEINVDSQGTVTVVGTVHNGTSQFYYGRWNSNGSLLAEKTFSDGGSAFVSGVVFDTYGEAYILGSSNQKGILRKVSTAGLQRWVQTFSEANFAMIPQDLAVFPGSGDILVVGSRADSMEGTTAFSKTYQQAPVAVADVYSVHSDETLTTSKSALANDRFAIGLTAKVVTGPMNGSLQFQGNGHFTYHPDSQSVGSQHITYSIQRPGLAPSIGKITINVSTPN